MSLTAGQQVAAAMQPVIDDFADALVIHLPRQPLLDGLEAVRKTLREHPELTDSVYDIKAPGLMSPLGLRIHTGADIAVFRQWAEVLSDVSTAAYRYEDSVDGEISGLLDNVRVRIVGLIPGDSVPEGSGAHEWTLPKAAA
jgi:hypothetical protein